MLAIFGIDGGALSLITQLLVLFLIVTYLALIYWTYSDAKRRIEDPVLIACATAASLFPFIGTIVYTILRPPEFLEDREERELELRAAELRLRQLIEQSCPHCEYPIERNYLRCPNCERRLRNPCRKCGQALDPRWGTCPYCEAEVRRTRTERTKRSERTERTERSERSDREARRSARANRDRTTRPTRPASDQRSASSTERSDGTSRRQQQRPAVGAQSQSRSQQRPSGGSQRPSS
jgi:hypothetical protein